jgi:3-phenylpropionate/trans-cinnamate dioxygenase ferredoxin subunit
MTRFVKVARVEDVPLDGRLYHEFDEETIIVFNVEGEFYAIADLCTHDDGPLGEGEVDGHDVVCPRHGARFDIRTGRALSLPAFKAVPSYQVKIEDGAIFVESPDEA